MSLEDFNSTVNGILDPIFDNEMSVAALRLFLAIYGGLAAPKIPVSWGPYLANSYVRILVMVGIIWIFNKDPATAILVAVSYFLTMHYLMKNSLKQVSQTGVVSPEVTILVSGGGGPTIKPASVIKAEATLMQSSLESKKTHGFTTPPQALISSGPTASTGTNASTIPSGTSANVSSMMSLEPDNEGGVPLAFTPDAVHDLAAAPN